MSEMLNDRFERKLPNGLVESYIVPDPGFKQGVGGTPSHYQTQGVGIFISHSSSDLEFIKLLLALLKSPLRLHCGIDSLHEC